MAEAILYVLDEETWPPEEIAEEAPSISAGYFPRCMAGLDQWYPAALVYEFLRHYPAPTLPVIDEVFISHITACYVGPQFQMREIGEEVVEFLNKHRGKRAYCVVK